MLRLVEALGRERFLQLKREFSPWGFLRALVLVLMGIYVFINPFPHVTAIKELCFYLSFFVVCLLVLIGKIDFSFQTSLLIPFCLFIIWVFIGLFFAVDAQNSLHDFYAHLLRYVAVYFIVINFFNSRNRFLALSRIIIASSTTYSILGIIYFYLIMGHSWTTRFSYVGATGLLGYEVFGNTICALMIFSIFLALNFFMDSSLRGKMILILCLVPQVALIFLVQSRGAFLALFLSLIPALWRYKKIQLVVLLLLIIMTAMSPIKNKVTMEQLMHNYRIKMVVTTLEVVKDYPMIGIGFGNETYGEKIDLHMYNNRAPKKYQQSDHLIIKAPHNMLLNILVRTGIVGLVLFLSILSVFAGMCWRCARNGADDFVRKWGLCIGSAFLAFLVIGMFEQMFHHVAEMLLYTILAMGTIVWRLNKNMRDTVPSGNSDQ